MQPGENVLDLCAAPGATSAVLAAALFAGTASGMAADVAEQDAEVERPRGRLVCNEPDRRRSAMLRDVLEASLPPQFLAKGGPVSITSVEATAKQSTALLRYGPFDKILVDAPCSTFRRLAKEPRVSVSGHGNDVSRGLWECNARTVKKHADLQHELLRCAAALVRPGGLIVYCTASLEAQENDEAVRTFLRRLGDEFVSEPGEDDSPICGAEATGLGTMILPDQGTLHGPLYIARIRRQG